MNNLVFPDTAILEFQLVLRGRGHSPIDVKMAILAVQQILRNHNIPEVQTINTNLLALQSELEESYLLSYFDSLIAASALKLDSHIISDDEAFDRIPELKRTPIKKHRKK
jgi:predicted nucleic acid-binding protein